MPQSKGQAESEGDSPDEVQEHRERYQELLQELRVILPGVQVLFAFLVTAPFSSRFPELDGVGMAGYATALVATTLSTVILMAPVAHHRLTNRHNRRHRVRVAIRLKLAGIAILGVAIVIAGFVVTRFVFGPTTAAWLTALVAGGVLAMWLALPLLDRQLHRGENDRG